MVLVGVVIAIEVVDAQNVAVDARELITILEHLVTAVPSIAQNFVRELCFNHHFNCLAHDARNGIGLIRDRGCTANANVRFVGDNVATWAEARYFTPVHTRGVELDALEFKYWLVGHWDGVAVLVPLIRADRTRNKGNEGVVAAEAEVLRIQWLYHSNWFYDSKRTRRTNFWTINTCYAHAAVAQQSTRRYGPVKLTSRSRVGGNGGRVVCSTVDRVLNLDVGHTISAPANGGNRSSTQRVTSSWRQYLHAWRVDVDWCRESAWRAVGEWVGVYTVPDTVVRSHRADNSTSQRTLNDAEHTSAWNRSTAEAGQVGADARGVVWRHREEGIARIITHRDTHFTCPRATGSPC